MRYRRKISTLPCDREGLTIRNQRKMFFSHSLVEQNPKCRPVSAMNEAEQQQTWSCFFMQHNPPLSSPKNNTSISLNKASYYQERLDRSWRPRELVNHVSKPPLYSALLLTFDESYHSLACDMQTALWTLITLVASIMLCLSLVVEFVA